MSALIDRWLNRGRAAKPAKPAKDAGGRPPPFAAFAERSQRGAGAPKQRETEENEAKNGDSDAVLSQLSQLSQHPAARDALALLLGLTPPPAPATVCRYCGRGGEPDAPLFQYLDGHADHGGWCPKKKRKKISDE